MISPDIFREQLLRGIYTRIASELGLQKSGRSHVSRVAHGERRSPRVEAALRREFQRIEAAVTAHRRRYLKRLGRAA